MCIVRMKKFQLLGCGHFRRLPFHKQPSSEHVIYSDNKGDRQLSAAQMSDLVKYKDTAEPDDPCLFTGKAINDLISDHVH